MKTAEIRYSQMRSMVISPRTRSGEGSRCDGAADCSRRPVERNQRAVDRQAGGGAAAARQRQSGTLGRRLGVRRARHVGRRARLRAALPQRRGVRPDAHHRHSPAWNVAKARKYAAELRQQIDRGHDPLAERQAVRAAPTTDELADRFEAEHLPKKRPATARDYKALLRKHIRPTLGSLKVAAVSSRDVERMHQRIAERAPYLANRTLAVTSKMFSLAVRWGLRPAIPNRGIERAPEQKCERYLTAPEIARLSAVLATHPERVSANVVRIC